MSTFVARRLVAVVPVLFLVTVLVFLMLDLVPGDVVDAMTSQNQAQMTAEDAARIRRNLGLDDPLPVRYVNWLWAALQGDLGTSIWSGQPVLKQITERFPSTLQLTLAGVGVAVVFGFALGTVAALNHGGVVDSLTMGVAMVAVSMPQFWFGLILLLVFAVELRWFPVLGQGGTMGLVLPALTLGIRSAAIISRLVRAGLIEVLSQDYIRTARAKGLPHAKVVTRHALSNTLIPVVTIVGLQFASLLGGAVIVEAVFVRRGIGDLVVTGIQTRDFPVVQGTILFIALLYVLVNLSVDLLYGFLDPRIRYS